MCFFTAAVRIEGNAKPFPMESPCLMYLSTHADGYCNFHVAVSHVYQNLILKGLFLSHRLPNNSHFTRDTWQAYFVYNPKVISYEAGS